MTFVGVDIGATAVRVAGISGLDSESYAKITHSAAIPLQPGAVVAGSIKDPEVVAFALRQAIRAAKVPAVGPVVGIASQATALAEIAMPEALSRHEWEPALRTSNAQLSPKVPLGAAALSLYPTGVGEDDEGNRSRNLLAAVALKDELATLARVCRMARVKPRAIDLAGAAAMRCMVRTQPGTDDVSTLIDIGASKITVVTRHGLHLRSVRTLPGGGEDLTRALMSATGLPSDRAEVLKWSMQIGADPQTAGTDPARQLADVYGAFEERTQDDPDEDAAIALRSASDALVEDVAGAVEADAAEFPKAPTEQLLMCGGTALLKGLRDQIVKRVGVPAIVARPWARVSPSKRTAHLLDEGTDNPLALHALTTAVGLAMWKDIS